MAGLLLWPLGQLVPVRLTDAHGADFTPPAHPAEGGRADAQGLSGLLGGQPLFLLAGRALEFGDGLFDEDADQLEVHISHVRSVDGRPKPGGRLGSGLEIVDLMDALLYHMV